MDCCCPGMTQRMSNPVADLTQRQLVLSPGQSFIVQAPAGSGKTELLIQRFLRLLATVMHPEEVIAITFTRKAAAEMRKRILDALAAAAAERVPESESGQQTFTLAREVLLTDERHTWQLLNNPNRLRIQTIDALCGSLTRQMPILSRFGSQPETVEDASELYLEAAGNTLALLERDTEWSGSVGVLLDHLDNDLPRVRDMLAAMLSRREQWIKHVAGNNIDRSGLENALKHAVEGTLDYARRQFPQDLIPELLALINYAAGNLMQEESQSAIETCIGLTGLPSAAAEAVVLWQGITDLLLTATGDWRKQANVRIGFPSPSNNKLEREQRTQMKERFKALLNTLSGNESLLRMFRDIRALPPVTYSEGDWQVVQALCILLRVADAQLQLLCAERNQVDFSGISRAALQALGESEAPTDLALRLDYRIRHILVDEFQDISMNQYLLLERLTAGWNMDDGHTLFLVGDPMQSIYRFREAEVGIYLSVWQQQSLGQVPVTPVHINVNFRSQAGIVEWVNKAFSRILPEVVDIDRGAVNYSTTVPYNTALDGNAVQIHPLLNAGPEQEAVIILDLIRQAQQLHPQGTTAILVRNRTHLGSIVPLLKSSGLRFRAVEVEPLGRRSAIQDLLSLTRALTQFADRVAWLAILRAPWCGLTLADLMHLSAGSGKRTLWACLQEEQRLQCLSDSGRNRLQRFSRAMESACRRRQRLSLRRWIESAWLELGGPATLQNETDLENAGSFFRLLDWHDAGGDLIDRKHFMQEVEKLFAAPDLHGDGRLQVMTMHKAKGLEFDTVILPGLARGSRNDEAQLLLWSVLPHGQHQDLLLAPVKQTGDSHAPIYDFIKRLHLERQFYEQGRLLYVAATRARRYLHLLGSVRSKEEGDEKLLKSPPAGSLLEQLWPLVRDEYMTALEQSPTPSGATGHSAAIVPRALRRLPEDWTMPPLPRAISLSGDRDHSVRVEPDQLIEYSWAGQTIRHIGAVVHRCIQWIAEEGLESWSDEKIRERQNYYRTALMRAGVQAGGLDEAVQQVIAALIAVTNGQRGRWLLDPSHQEVKNEYPISGIYKGILVHSVIDRTFIADGIRWIIDYKTSRHEGHDLERFLDQEQQRYRGQLEKYAALMLPMDRRPIRLGLYFPLLQGWREWSHPSISD